MKQRSFEFPNRGDLTPEIPPTWAEDSAVFHTSERCARLRVIPRGKRVAGKPPVGLRHCFNCEDIARTKRRG